MPGAYSADLRERVLAAGEEEGLSPAAAATRFRVGERTVYRWRREARHEGRRYAKAPAGGPRPVTEGTEDVLHELATGPTTSDATLAEQAALDEARTGRKLSPSTLCRAFRRLGLTRKKDAPRRRARAGGHPGGAGGLRRADDGPRPAPAGARGRGRRGHRSDPQPRSRAQGSAGPRHGAGRPLAPAHRARRHGGGRRHRRHEHRVRHRHGGLHGLPRPGADPGVGPDPARPPWRSWTT
jgi:transposase